MPKVILAGILDNSLANGKGIRKAFFAQGCKHHCEDCFNPHTWSFKGGVEFDCDQLIKETINQTYLAGITFTGGDPFEQAEAFAYIANGLNKKYNVWVYTGYTYDEILEIGKTKPCFIDLLKSIDVLIDGKFIKKLADSNLKYKGSSNQRIIDIKKTLKSNTIILFDI